jgi:hypothetical protein
MDFLIAQTREASSWFDRFHPSEIIGLTATVAVFAVPITAIVCWAWSSWRKAELKAQLIARLADHGMTADDIVRVLASGGFSPDKEEQEEEACA